MIMVWLWDTDGPGHSASGVTADEATAKAAARTAMIATGAAAATVEQAAHLAGGGWMRSGYSRTGTGWTAASDGSRVRWAPLSLPAVRAAS